MGPGRSSFWFGAQWRIFLLLPVLSAGSDFIEDVAHRIIEPSVFMVAGAAPASKEKDGTLVGAHMKKSDLTHDLAMDFLGPVKALRQQVDSLERSVRIFVHEVPRCIGEEVFQVFGVPLLDALGDPQPHGESKFGWRLAVQLHAKHAAAVHYAIVNSPYITTDPANATMFYIPAFPGLLVERFIDTQNTDALNCISEMWHDLPDYIFDRNGGYDHFMVAGTCHPYSICDTLECDVTQYHPFAGNVAVLVGGVREFGSTDAVFNPSSVYRNLRIIPVPFPVRLDCRLLDELTRPESADQRPIAVSFIGTANSRVRHHFLEATTDPRWPLANDPRVYVQLLPDAEAGENARRAALDKAGMDGDSLYARSEFCLVLPGHVYEPGRRFWDVVSKGCIPVVVSSAPLHVVFPFAWQLPWEDVAILASADSPQEAAEIVETLVAATASLDGHRRIAERRAALVRRAPAMFLPPLRNCPDDALSAVSAIVRELAIRQATLAALRVVRPPGWHKGKERRVKFRI